MPAQLWLLRHGEAVPHESKPDTDRELTARGERQAVAAGLALARLGLEVDACYTSPKGRGGGARGRGGGPPPPRPRAGVRRLLHEPEGAGGRHGAPGLPGAERRAAG